MNAEIKPPGAVGGKVPEIKPVKQLSFVPTQSVKAKNYNSEYSDVIDTDDEILETQQDIDASNREAIVTAENLAAESSGTSTNK